MTPREEGLGAAMWGMVLTAAGICLALWWLTSCATQLVTVLPDGGIESKCAAIGENAKAIISIPTGDAGIITNAPNKLVSCEGGPIVPALIDGVGTVIKAVFSWLPALL